MLTAEALSNPPVGLSDPPVVGPSSAGPITGVKRQKTGSVLSFVDRLTVPEKKLFQRNVADLSATSPSTLLTTRHLQKTQRSSTEHEDTQPQ